ncbi:MAG: hypothetical protein M1365_12405 [Actinobacteria bacterium]|nr:hypothetical protein [Actinomycetota bacterium]
MGQKELDIPGPCENPGQHAPDCNGVGETRDHITPKSIARLLGWTESEIKDPNNIQHLSQACHRQKDGTTPIRLEVLTRQLAGEFIGFELHTKLINGRGNGNGK